MSLPCSPCALWGSLYNVVVDSDDIAARLVGYLNQENGGRITFIPLNRATAPPLNYPQTDDVQPLLSILRFDRQVTKACAQVRHLCNCIALMGCCCEQIVEICAQLAQL